MEAAGERRLLSPVPAASGARYELAGDPGTYVWTRGEGAMVGLAGTDLPECRVALPRPETPWQAQGSEPFWSVVIDAGRMTLIRLGMEDLDLPLMEAETGMTAEGDILVTAAEGWTRAQIVRQPVLCRDSMTGMPYPETVTVTLGDHTLTGCGGAPADLLVGQTWVVEDIGGAGIIDAARVTLGFATDGRVAGSGGCNRWFAGYALTGEGLGIGQAGATMMACAPALMDQEQRFFAALGQVTRFDIDDTGALRLIAGDMPVITARAATDGSAP
jgi:heat shock protein HslJ